MGAEFTWVKIGLANVNDSLRGVNLSCDDEPFLNIEFSKKGGAACYQLENSIFADSTLKFQIRSLQGTVDIEFLSHTFMEQFYEEEILGTSITYSDVVNYRLDENAVSVLANLKREAEDLNSSLDTHNQKVRELTEKLQTANSAVSTEGQDFVQAKVNHDEALYAFNSAKDGLTSANAIIDAYNSGEFASYAEALAAYEYAVTALADAESAYAAASQAVQNAKTSYDAAQAAKEAAETAAREAGEAYNEGVYEAVAAQGAYESAVQSYEHYKQYGADRRLGDEWDEWFYTEDYWHIAEANGFNGYGPLGFDGNYFPNWNDSDWTLANVSALGNAPSNATPEPATLLILGLGLAGLGLARRRRK
jgi:hypothetical protein